MGKGEIGHNEHFLLFPQCFLLNQIIVSPFVNIFDIISLFAAEFEEPKTGVSGKWLICVLRHSQHSFSHITATYMSSVFLSSGRLGL